MSVKRIAVFSIKGGSGKTTVTIGLARALQVKGFKIGLFDGDISGPKMPTALGIEKSDHGKFPLPVVDVNTSRMYPVKFEGFEVFSEAFLFGDKSLSLPGGDRVIKIRGENVELKGTGIYSMVEQNLQSVTFSPDLDYIIYDLPPTSSDPVLSLFKHLPNIYGCILICQPTSQSVDDIKRSIDLLKQKKIPVIGMVGNMAEAICPDCGKPFYPFSDDAVDLKQFCQNFEIPYLISLPLTPDKAILKAKFLELAGMVQTCKPVDIWKLDFKTIFERKVLKNATKMAAKQAANEEQK